MAPDGAAMARRDFEGRTSKPDQFDAARVAPYPADQVRRVTLGRPFARQEATCADASCSAVGARLERCAFRCPPTAHYMEQ